MKPYSRRLVVHIDSSQVTDGQAESSSLYHSSLEPFRRDMDVGSIQNSCHIFAIGL
jgi:hypothetical protein